MLPFGLKLAWCALSLSGLIGSWAVLLPLAWALQSYWAPIGYAVGVTVLEIIFCLGLVWRMDPVNMPRAFCLVQVLSNGLATFFLIGILAAITIATTLYIAKPKQWGPNNESTILPWRYYYLLPMMLFPLLASAVHITVVVYFDTFEPFDGLSCISHPLWTSFVGFAGTPFLITIPCLWLTLLSAIRVFRTHSHIRRARRSIRFDNLTALPQRKAKLTVKTPLTSTPGGTPRAITSPSPSPSFMLRLATNHEPHREPISPVLRDDKIRNYHLPFIPPSPDYITAHSGHARQDSGDSFDTVSSVSFAEMTGKTAPRNKAVELDDVTAPLRPNPVNDNSNALVITPKGTLRSTRSFVVTPVSIHSIHASDRMAVTQHGFSLQGEDPSDTSEYFSYPSRMSWVSEITPSTRTTERQSPSELPVLVRNLLIFQLAIIGIHLLSCITPIVDIASAASASHPARVGTQHVALLLAGWAPVFVFGPLSAVRSHLKFWP
ncbi:fungal-trans domain-containing protein [Favolaschia claudopus]|uniref:Fungal-trans domain-containing protein n=1 Tax=Favolaschia claudopus TaxID=2862362 RepID=A0AAW0A8A9_9AGAR